MSTKPVTDAEPGVSAASPEPRRRLRRPDRRAALATLAGACVHVYLQVQMLLTLPNFSFHGFKGFFASDQLSYLGIALNVANGRSGSTEPFTETGVSHYPRLYYVVMGLLSRASGVDPVVMWWLMGLTLQFVLACFIGWTLYVTTRRWWMAVLAPLPFLIGTFAGVLDNDYLQRTPSGRGVMWGPFALVFPLNGGTAGVSLAACAVLGLLIAGWRGFPPRQTMLAGIFAAICLGVVGNLQTYSFIGLCYILLYSTAVYGLQSQARRRWLLPVASAALLVAILLVGSSLAARFGPLPVFVLGLLPALPGYLVVCRLTSWRLLWVTLLGAVLALPTIIDTMLGLAHKDPFLVYRQASTGVQGTLGIPLTYFLERGAVAILLLLILALVPHAKSKLIRSYAIGAFLTWSLLTFNDHWGPDQEPYRFWIDQFMLVLVTGFPLLACMAAGALRGARRQVTPVAALTAFSLVIWVSAATLSAKDWWVFNGAARAAGVSWWPSPRSTAVASVVSLMPQDGIIVSDSCTDPLSLKAITGARVAYYNSGLAWPDHRVELSRVEADRARGKLDSSVALGAGVDYLLTDSHCPMPTDSEGHIRPVGSGTYVDAQGKPATLRLWKITA